MQPGNKGRRLLTQLLSISLLLTISLAVLTSALGFQQPGGRDPGASSNAPPNKKENNTRKNTSKDLRPKVRLAELTIVLSHECDLFLDGQPLDYRRASLDFTFRSQRVRLGYDAATRTVTLKGLKPEPYVILASKSGYQDYSRLIPLTADDSNVVTVALRLKPGVLTVSPDVIGGRITVVNLETGATLGPYTNRLNTTEVAPGSYSVSVSKDGYLTTSRDITVRPGETLYLEPHLEPEPEPTPVPTTKPVIPIIPSSVSVESSGKYLIFRVVGTSGETTPNLGTINTVFNPVSGTGVQGLLPGAPCRVDFVKLENVAEGSLVETPGPSNRWSALVIRIRPKDKKRPIRFAVNWILLPN
jgi:hypothetical protein